MKVSKFVKVNKNILLEYVYDNENNISDSYKILINLKDNLTNYSYISGGTNVYDVNTKNTLTNQLFKLDSINNVYGLIDTTNYSFLQIKDYGEGFPARHDTLKILFPTNYTFGEYIGFYIRVYTFDYNNAKTYDLSNFYYDSTDATQLANLEFTNPPLYFQETVWGKSITIHFPSTSYLSSLRSGNTARPSTINSNLTNTMGLSNTSPVFIDFHFIRSKKTLNGVVSYTLTANTPISLPQAPDFEKLGLKVNHSKNGDFFEIYGTYNGNIGEFNSFMNNSVLQGKRYYVEYDVTVYEQNIRGKTTKMVMTDNFNEKFEYRPIIKFSTTTAIIDVVMNIIDAVDSNTIQRRASYGMLQDEVAKYSLNLTKINLAKSNKPKIYNIKSPEGAGIFGNLSGSAYSDGRLYGNAGGSLFSSNTSKNIFGMSRKTTSAPTTGAGGIAQISDQSRPQVILQPVPVDRLVLSDRFSILSKSENVKVGNKSFFGNGKLQIVLYTFDNIVQFFLARDVNQIGSGTDTTLAPEYLDLTNVGEVKMVIKNQQQTLDFPLYTESQRIDLSIGQIVFRIPASKMGDVRKIFDSGVNLFYITATNNSLQTVIYSGLFTIYDSASNVATLNQDQVGIQADLSAAAGTGEDLVVTQLEPLNVGTALVTRRIVTAGGGSTTQTNATNTANQNATTNNLVNSSVSQTFKEGEWTYEITTNSSLVIDGFEYSNQKLKTAFVGSNSEKVDIVGLSIKSTNNGATLQSRGNQVLGLMSDIRAKLFASLNSTERTQANQTSETFRINAKNNTSTSQSTTMTATASVVVPPQSTSSNKIAFGGVTYEISTGVGNKLTISAKEATNSYMIYQEQLQILYPTITVWTNSEFRNNSQLFANGTFVDNINNVLTEYKKL